MDVADLDEAHALIKLADGQAPVGGVFHLAMILSDRFMTNQVQPFKLQLPKVLVVLLQMCTLRKSCVGRGEPVNWV